jgi:cytochrome P450
MMSVEYDLESQSFFNDPYPTFARMRRENPIYQSPTTGLWYASRYQDVLEICRDRRFSSQRVDLLFTEVGPELSEEVAVVHRFFSDWVGFLDPPAHGRLRRIINRAFTPARMNGLRPYIEQIVRKTIDSLPADSSFDLVKKFCFPIPAQVIAYLLGVPDEDLEKFLRWSDEAFGMLALLGDPDAAVRTAYKGVLSLEGYFRDLVGQGGDVPDGGLLTLLLKADENGEHLTDQELVTTCAMSLIAGHETTTNLIGNSVIALLRNPVELARLRAEPRLIESAVEEFQRYDSATGGIGRIASVDLVLGNQDIRAGEMVMGLPWSANRDELVFDAPDRLDIGRKDSRHLGFAHGPHVCAAAMLARMETQIAVNAVVSRFPRLQLVTDKLDSILSFASRGVVSLPVSV